MRRLGPIVAAIAVTAVTVVTVQGWADGSAATDAVPRQLAYKGTLEKDGAAYSGVMTMTFKLYDGSSSSAAWTESQTVTVYNGAFQVMLGAASTTSATNLDTLVKYGDDLYLSVTLNTTSGDVTLTNKQRFYPVPYAGWATSAADFSVGDDLTVADATELKGTLSVANTSTFTKKLTASADVQVDGTLTTKNISGGGTLGVSGATTLSSTLGVTGATTLSNTLGVTGAATLSSTLSLNSNTANIAFTGNGSASPGPSSGGWKMKTYGSEAGIGVETSAQWYTSSGSHYWYSTGDAGSTFTKRMSLDNTGKLSLTGALNPKEGNGSSYGIQFSDNIGGGSGDTAYIRYYAVSGETTRLEIGVGNDSDDGILFTQDDLSRLYIGGGEVALMEGTPISYGSCASNWTLKDDICYRRYTSGATWLSANSACHSAGGHLCTIAEAAVIWGTGTCSAAHSTGDWLGDMAIDDYPFSVNDNCSQLNFESDNSKKTDSKPYVCCQNLR